jgi:hypothetical protein
MKDIILAVITLIITMAAVMVVGTAIASQIFKGAF